jgi:hypothetical protein
MMEKSPINFHDEVDYMLNSARKTWSTAAPTASESTLPTTILEEHAYDVTKMKSQLVSIQNSIYKSAMTSQSSDWKVVMNDFYKQLKNIEVFISM